MDENKSKSYNADVQEMYIKFAERLFEFLRDGWNVELMSTPNFLNVGIHLFKNGKHAYQLFTSHDSYGYYRQAYFILDILKTRLLNEFPYLNTESGASYVGT